MKKELFILLSLVSFHANAQIYKTDEGNVSFFSEAPLQNIDATSKHLVSAINCLKEEIVFEVGIKSFEFKNKKMQDDFNEDFMDSDKFPTAFYKGKINETVNWMQNGTYKITSSGTLRIHGIEKQRTDTANITIENGKIKIMGSFKVKPADHGIKIPEILNQKIAETISVKFDGKYSELKLIGSVEK